MAHPATLPDGRRYGTVVDSEYRRVRLVDAWLFHLAFGRDYAESTTTTYARGVALYLCWCARQGLDPAEGARRMGAFMVWLRYARPDGCSIVVDVARRGDRTINGIVVAVRQWLLHLVAMGEADVGVVSALIEVGDARHLPPELRLEGAPLRAVARPRHRLSVPEAEVVPPRDADVVALIRACNNPRDRFLVITLARTGLRRGELTGMRREDVHLLEDARALRCAAKGPHLHVRRRRNSNGATAKSRKRRTVPVDGMIVLAWAAYAAERHRVLGAADLCDYLLVNLYGAPVGEPMRPGAINELLQALSRRAGLARPVHPHGLRHYDATALFASGAQVDTVQKLLGHAHPGSLSVYLHASEQRMREAVERLPDLRDFG